VNAALVAQSFLLRRGPAANTRIVEGAEEG
jgi:hypothetical protein